MQNKKSLHRHLLTIYVIYFVALFIGFMATIVPSFSRGWNDAENMVNQSEMLGDGRIYSVSAPLVAGRGETLNIEGLPEGVTSNIQQIALRVRVPENYTIGNAFKVNANSGWAYLLMAVMGLSFLAVFVLFALIINSLRKSIRNEQPICQCNISRTRWIGILILVAEFCRAAMLYINIREASRLLADTSLEVATAFPLNYWEVIVGILFLFMAEVFSVGTQLSEEQKLTI
ncbi:MAG: DUF2975 domain-containing protein [Rikenellaceae bacterium]|nr:DUF2975 domain-containing protein [Rikenellaceae bacterium]